MKKIIGFGEDVIVGCTQMSNKTELEILCTATESKHPLLSTSTLSHFANSHDAMMVSCLSSRHYVRFV